MMAPKIRTEVIKQGGGCRMWTTYLAIVTVESRDGENWHTEEYKTAFRQRQWADKWIAKKKEELSCQPK